MQGAYKKARKTYYLRRTAQNIAAVLVVILMCSGVFLSVNGEARAAFYGWCKEIYQIFFSYQFSERTTPSSPNEYGLYVPTWIPDGYSEIGRADNGLKQSIVYANENGDMIKYQQIYSAGSYDLFVSAKNAEISTVKIGEVAATLLIYPNGDTANVIIWTSDAGQLFQISSYEDKDILLRIAKSIMCE